MTPIFTTIKQCHIVGSFTSFIMDKLFTILHLTHLQRLPNSQPLLHSFISYYYGFKNWTPYYIYHFAKGLYLLPPYPDTTDHLCDLIPK